MDFEKGREKMSDVLEINNLEFSVKDRIILDGVNIEIKENTTVGIIGPNGSGKTTFLKHIYRSIKPKNNCVYLYGEDINSLSYNDSAKMISVMKQENSGDFKFSVLDMVLLGRSPYLKYFESFKEEDISVAIKALQKVGMEKHIYDDFRFLSGGEKQRVLLARTLAQSANVLILDEPTNHLDVYYQWLLMKIIGDLNKTIVAVFHDLNLASKFCDQIYIMNKGRVAVYGSPNEVITVKNLKEFFNVDCKVIMEDDVPYVIYKGTLI